MSQFLPTPAISPFNRLQATDGLLINAQRWNKVQEYHRLRQNFHYQSLHRPGIVSGLGVRPIAINGKEPSQYRDGRSVQIQPGIAIDLEGNPIIVPQTENIQIALEPPQNEPLTIYLTISYRDPKNLAIREGQEMVREQYRIDLKTKPPSPLEVEICRLLLPPKQPIRPSIAADILSPGYHNLDFRFRQLATVRSQGMIRIAQILHSDEEHNRNFINLDYLLKATIGLYPQLEGVEPVGLVNLTDAPLENYDLLYLTGKKLSLNKLETEALKRYLGKGGVLLSDAISEDTEIVQNTLQFAQQQLNLALKPLSKRHYLRRQPFLFAALPQNLQKQQLKMLVNGGIILVTGDLASMWGVDDQLTLSRETIRAAQELGINILHYAWKRHSLTKLQFPGG